jgi:transketolase
MQMKKYYPQDEKKATRDAYGEALVEWGSRESRVVVLDADLSQSTKTVNFAKAFPERFFQMGVAEQDLMGTAAGFALAGKIAFASSFAIFATGRAFEQIRNSIAYPNLNVKVAATHAGITVGEDGSSHQALEDIAIMRAIPNMQILVPADAQATREAVRIAIETEGPFYIRMGRSALPLIYDETDRFALGKGKLLREGKAATVITSGVMVAPALVAAEKLAKEGIDLRVIDAFSIKPLDRELILSAARQTRGLVTVEEHNTLGGLGGAVAELVSSEAPTRVLRLGTGDRFGQSGKPAALLKEYGLTVEDIVGAVKKLL